MLFFLQIQKYYNKLSAVILVTGYKMHNNYYVYIYLVSLLKISKYCIRIQKSILRSSLLLVKLMNRLKPNYKFKLHTLPRVYNTR